MSAAANSRKPNNHHHCDSRRNRDDKKFSELPKKGEQNNNDHRNISRRNRDDKNHSVLPKNTNWTFDHFHLYQMLGSGGYGKVYKAKEKITKITVALKITCEAKSKSRNYFKVLNREISILWHLKQVNFIMHRNILKLYDYFEDRSYDVLILEFAKKGALYDMLRKEKHFTEQRTAKYMSQLISAVQYLHSKSIVHRDIKAENVLVDENDVVKLADFGLSAYLSELSEAGAKHLCGTLNYLAPEVLRRNGYDEKVDLWAVGVLIYKLLVGKLPFDDDSSDEIKWRILKRKFTIPKNMSEEAKDVIIKLLRNNPDGRIKLSELAKHPWIIQNKC
ncbi:Aurora kinase A [Trichinella zimbabwensis]|uniref:Aurora kinase A n=1 Tax=Trichinella zimbabwensis TaxID=268475 RepID=A0A0V1GZP0_9BILA|nr:Aurora kinase A [Trichinella zimbabwensis]